MIEFMAITNDVQSGALWHAAGVQRIMVDLERYGKAERQQFRDTVKSHHTTADIGAMRQAVPTAHIVARCEPVTMPRWARHLEEVLDQKPTSVMLPMVESAADVEQLNVAIQGRADLIVMVETSSALTAIDELAAAAPHATFFVGLNDLHIQLGHRFMFEPLSNGDVDAVAESACDRGASFGFGGLARPGYGLVDSAAVVGEHVRLGSTLAILARSFFNSLDDPLDVAEIASEIEKLRAAEEHARSRDRAEQQADTRDIREAIRQVAEQMIARS